MIYFYFHRRRRVDFFLATFSLFAFGILILATFVGVGASFAVRTTHDNADFFPPVWGGGFQLIDAHNGYGEPLNVSYRPSLGSFVVREFV